MIEFNLSEKDQKKLEIVLKSRKRPFTKHEIRTFFVDQLNREFHSYLYSEGLIGVCK